MTGQCGPMTTIVEPTSLFLNAQYNVTACGTMVFYWNSTHMYGMGGNHGGLLGSADFTGVDTRCVGAVPITAFSDAGETVLGLTCNMATTFAWTASGNVYGWGSNQYKQLGLVASTLALPTKIPVWHEPITSVSVGEEHVLAQSQSGQVICWGVSSYGQCGFAQSTSVWPAVALTIGSTPVISYAAGNDHSVAATEDGLAYAWGANNQGQACRYIQGFSSAAPHELSTTTPIYAQALYGRPVVQVYARNTGTYLLTDEGRLFGCGKNMGAGYGVVDWWVDRPREIFVLPPASGGYNSAVSSMITSATSYHNLAVTNDLVLAGTGSNSVGQLGLNHTDLVKASGFLPLTDVVDPVVAGSIGGYQSIITTDSSKARPAKTTLPPQCEVQGCPCPQPLADAICVNGAWTGPEIVVWSNTTINQTINLIGNLTLAPSGSLIMPIGLVLHVRGCAKFYGGIINYTATQDMLLQYVETPLYFINTTCGLGQAQVVVTVQGKVDPCNYTVFNGAQQGPEGYFLTFSQVTCKKSWTWIAGAVIGGVVGLVIVVLLIVFLIPRARRVVFPFWARHLVEEGTGEEAINLSPRGSHYSGV